MDIVEILLVVLIVLVLGAGALLLALWKRTRGAGDAAALRAERDGLRADLDAEQTRRVQAETRLETEREKLAEQRRLLAEAETSLKDAFKALSAEALKESREAFLGQADERLKPIRDLLGDYQKRLGEIEKARGEAYGSLEQHLRGLRQDQQALQREAGRLSQALRSPTVRGRWGELTLRRVVELAGMSRYCDFDEQASMDGHEGRLRPDMVVHLPNDRLIVVDSKVPLDSYITAVEASDEATRQRLLADHARAVRARMRDLGLKAYASHLDTAPDFVVLFLPGESFFSAALEQDRALIEDGMEAGVVLATPTTLIALLRAVAYGWQQQDLAENAQRIADAGRDLYDRVRVFAEHLDDVGRGLRGASDAYDRAVGSYQGRLEPGARRLAELGASSGKDLPEVEAAEGPTRSLPPAGDDDAAESPGRGG